MSIILTSLFLMSLGEDATVEVKNERSRRSAAAAPFQSPAKDANGNRILRVVRRDAKDVADLETEKVIQVNRAASNWKTIENF